VLYDETLVAELAEIERQPGRRVVKKLPRSRCCYGALAHARRPHCDTLKGSKHPNMKNYASACRGEWRVAFALIRAARHPVGGRHRRA